MLENSRLDSRLNSEAENSRLDSRLNSETENYRFEAVYLCFLKCLGDFFTRVLILDLKMNSFQKRLLFSTVRNTSKISACGDSFTNIRMCLNITDHEHFVRRYIAHLFFQNLQNVSGREFA